MPQASPSKQLVQGRWRLHFTAEKRLFPINFVDAASQVLPREQGVSWRMEALPHDIVAGVVDHKVAAVEEGYFCVLARRCSALPHRGTIGICKYQVAFVVQRYPGAVFVHGRVATLRGVGVCRPDDGSIGGACGVPDGEGESICAKLVESAREGAVR